MSRINVVVVGSKGRKLGQPVCKALLAAEREFELCGAVVRDNGHAVGRDPGELGGALVAQSFSALARELPLCEVDWPRTVVFYAVKAEPLVPRVEEAIQHGFRIHVIGTTGLREDDARRLCTLAQGEIGVIILHSANFSDGANDGAERCAQLGRRYSEAEVEIIETHHSQKEDAPSGTALYWARAIAAARGQNLEDVVKFGRSGKGKRAPQEICIHSIRIGNVTGQHRALFGVGGQIIPVEHIAESSDLFARGALGAIRWAVRHWVLYKKWFQHTGGFTETEMSELSRLQRVYRMYDVHNLELLKELDVY
ncbi:MAG: 4-hydroxy-tetrahydrodipicolinate reductase [Parcubacteria group bacterium]|nr:4-hydroxy-tetrahydrodipicolinate reductase [Parcubacteria group bacterium]